MSKRIVAVMLTVLFVATLGLTGLGCSKAEEEAAPQAQPGGPAPGAPVPGQPPSPEEMRQRMQEQMEERAEEAQQDDNQSDSASE